MAAVELSRLHTQIQLLVKDYPAADQFVKHLRELYEFYADRTFSPLALVDRPLSVDAYNASPLVNRQFALEFGKLCEENPLNTLDVVDALWEETKLEPRLLAADLLGKLPLEYRQQVIERLKDWTLPTENRELINALHERGTLRLRKESIGDWLEVIRDWLKSEDSYDQIFGLQSLIPIIKDPGFENLPELYDLLSLIIDKPRSRVLSSLQNVLQVLARRSPVETVYFLKKVLAKPHSPELPRLFRRLLPDFPAEQAQSLRNALKESSPEK